MKILQENWIEIRKEVILPLWIKKFKGMYENAKLDYDDFESLAAYELTKTIKHFDSQKSNLFTYATNVIQKKAMTELRDCTQRDVRKALYVSDSVNAIDKNIIENIPCHDTKADQAPLSEKMVQYLNRLSCLQKQILFLMSIGFDKSEIKIVLKITEKDLMDALCGIRAYRNVSILF